MDRATADVVRTQGGVITRSQALQGYRERHNWLTAQGWTMIYATARQILSVPDELIAQLA
ncbi:MAG: hypothetical protein M3Y19_07590 [Actinomycetota bacterium]|nr:hypothetical protein [Actinomycetota bacterium]